MPLGWSFGLAEPAVAAAKAAVAAEEDDLKDTRRGVRGWALLDGIRIERVDIGRLLHNTHTGPPGEGGKGKENTSILQHSQTKHNMAPSPIYKRIGCQSK